jgi:hypothetical protein
VTTPAYHHCDDTSISSLRLQELSERYRIWSKQLGLCFVQRLLTTTTRGIPYGCVSFGISNPCHALKCIADAHSIHSQPVPHCIVAETCQLPKPASCVWMPGIPVHTPLPTTHVSHTPHSRLMCAPGQCFSLSAVMLTHQSSLYCVTRYAAG